MNFFDRQLAGGSFVCTAQARLQPKHDLWGTLQAAKNPA
jgi:hypothetical protein